MKIRPVGAEMFHADGRTDGQTDLTDMTKLIITFRNFEKTPKKRHCPRASIKNYCCFDKTNVLLT